MSALASPPSGGGSRRRNVLTALVSIVVLVVVFGVVLPQVIDYNEVWQTLRSVEPGYVFLLLLAGLVYYVPEGWLYSMVLPGLNLWRGIQAWVASTAAGSTAPAIDLATRYGMYRSWGSTPTAAMQGIVLSGVFDWVVKFTIPIVAVVALIAAGVQDLGPIVVIPIVAAALLGLVLVVLVLGARSERFADWLADRVSSATRRVLARFNRPEPENLKGRILQFREEALSLGLSRTLRAALASTLGKLWQFVMLLIALRAVEIPAEVLSPVEVFIAWSLVLLITMIPITPGGIGVAAFFYVGILVSAAGDEWANAIGAGVLLYRVFQWALPIPVGWFVIWVWRRGLRQGRLTEPAN